MDSLGGQATASVQVTPGVVVSPSAANLPVGGTETFQAQGGSGVGYVWELASNNSGSTLSADGRYMAGTKGGVTDVVHAIDSLGNVGTATVAVSASSGGCGVDEGGAALPWLLAPWLVLLGRRRRRA